MKKLDLKSYLSGAITIILMISLLFSVSAATSTKTLTATYKDIKFSVNGTTITPKDAAGKTIEPFLVDGNAYLPVKSVAEAVGYDAVWDDPTSTVKLNKLSAELSSYTPTKNEGTILNITGDKKYDGLPFTATLYYKTTQTKYEGKVGDPCTIKTSSATSGYTVVVYVVVQDEKNDKKYELFTTFTPK